MVDRHVRAAKFPAVKSLDSFDFTAIPSLNKMLVTELARGEYILRRENIIALGNSGTGKSHVALALGLAACQRGFSVGFATAAGLVHQLMEARDEQRLLRLQAQLAAHKLLIADELGYVPLSPTARSCCLRSSAALRAGLDHRDLQPAVRGLDIHLRLRTADPRAARSSYSPRPYPGIERRQLPAETVKESPPERPRPADEAPPSETVGPQTGEVSP